MSFVQDYYDDSIFRRADAVIIVYDCCDKESFSSVYNWYKVVQYHCEIIGHPVVLVGNKIDKTNKRVVNCSEAEKFADDLGFFAYVEISAKLGQGIIELFMMIAKNLVTRVSIYTIAISFVSEVICHLLNMIFKIGVKSVHNCDKNLWKLFLSNVHTIQCCTNACLD